MKVKEVVVTESGIELIKPDDGFILYGALLKADRQSGLLGDGDLIDVIENNGRAPTAYTNQEFLESLCLPISVFEDYIIAHSAIARSN